MTTRDDERRLVELLRLGDPADDGDAPTAQEAMELRRVMLRGARTSSAPLRWLPLATVAATAIAAAALLLPPDRAPSIGPTPVRADGEPSASDDARQIRFATENGTQIIWVLDPDLEL